MSVEFKKIPVCEGYCVGDNGTIWSRWRSNGKGFELGRQYRQLKFGNSRGYLFVRLKRTDGLYVTWYVHRLVLDVFIGNCPDNMEGCHNDGNKANNNLSNLRWDTKNNNMLDIKKHGSRNPNPPCGEKHHNAKLTVDKVRQIRLLYKTTGITCDELGQQFGVSSRSISDVMTNKSWKHVV